MILRLPEKRDFFTNSDPDPVTNFYTTKQINKNFFRKNPNDRIELDKFG